MKIHPMWHEYPTLAPELASALAMIEKQITTNNTPVAKAIMEMINGGGKLLRPAYCLLFSRFQDVDREKMIALAAAIETLHTATLIHDDIIDKSPTRRNQVTIQKQFGPDTAVYAGDYLFVVCFKLLSHYASSLRSIQQDSGSMEKILKGELDQMAPPTKPRLPSTTILNRFPVRLANFSPSAASSVPTKAAAVPPLLKTLKKSA